MASQKSYAEISGIINNGGGVSVSAKKYSFAELSEFAAGARRRDVRLIIREADSLSYAECNALASAGRGSVLLEF